MTKKSEMVIKGSVLKVDATELEAAVEAVRVAIEGLSVGMVGAKRFADASAAEMRRFVDVCADIKMDGDSGNKINP